MIHCSTYSSLDIFSLGSSMNFFVLMHTLTYKQQITISIDAVMSNIFIFRFLRPVSPMRKYIVHSLLKVKFSSKPGVRTFIPFDIIHYGCRRRCGTTTGTILLLIRSSHRSRTRWFPDGHRVGSSSS